MSRALRIALCQTSSEFSEDGTDPRLANMDKALEWIHRAADKGANLALFGEVCLNGYRSDTQLRDFANQLDPPDEHVKMLLGVSRETGVYIAMGLCRRGSLMPGNLFNSAVLIGPERVMGYYDKVHLGNFPLPDGRLVTEAIYWNPGWEYRVFDTPSCRIGLQICRDIRYPEASRVLTLMGAELIINLAASVKVYQSFLEWFSRTRANENQIWFAMTSLVGRQKDLVFSGGSRVVSPTGDVVARAKDNREDLVVCDIDLDEVYRARALSHVLDRRVPRAYRLIRAEDETWT